MPVGKGPGNLQVHPCSALLELQLAEEETEHDSNFVWSSRF